MGPNDVELTRVYTRRVGQPVADSTLSSAEDFEVVTEVEAGFAEFDKGAKYTTGIVIRDLSADTNIPHHPNSMAGALGDPPWKAQAEQLVYHVKKADLKNREGHLCEIYAYLLEGKKDPDASFLRSQLFLIQP